MAANFVAIGLLVNVGRGDSVARSASRIAPLISRRFACRCDGWAERPPRRLR
jgi:hypothetical protein